jgi:hypothetical protein
MSLDVYLVRKKWVSYDELKTFTESTEEIFNSNITHNFAAMAEKAGLYETLWRPYRLKKEYIEFENRDEELKFEEKQITKAIDIIPYLEKGLKDLELRPNYFQTLNLRNGCGEYIDFFYFVKKYLDACNQYPESIVIVSR